MSSHGVLPYKPARRVTFTAGGGEHCEIALSVDLISEAPSGNKSRMAASALSGLQSLKCAEN
ncbi:hypothetical protein E2J82_03365 [Salmonella enterica subsp. enterica serovar Ohio]|uniref:Uncharacterized protein n=1 Tax=Salmonella enterica subsp. enterica serovar Ohio TaxID=117541 RepID=A0A3W0PDG5_SALET|nr:hypothetical protein CHC58_04650 [Salmonella enterica]AXE15181.1 hypothetical protein DOE64_04650 [Salmonella enterica subsp. enterica serovar Ohio]EAW2276738.1 hypothetical protein [Salmonella enterica subsp. enterica]EBB4402837.1 hypothetical protein [Salmonella enterica subsp. enterica serovar Typhimurium]EBC8086650.1 hypothetical protein [Salmonella enterica subsp. enterica serovar Infantis]